MKAHRILTWPLSLIWGSILRLRHGLYNAGILPSTGTSIPSIVVGNLAFGGTGKTPHVLWLVAHFCDRQVAVLSRGHGRRSSGYRKVTQEESAETVGDEPLLMFLKEKKAQFHVGEDRVGAAQRITVEAPNTELLILDDAFQHRKIKAKLNILLTTWSEPYSADYLVPSGRLRDLKSRASQAQVVIVTQCPKAAQIDESSWRTSLKLKPEQHLFFSSYKTLDAHELTPNFSGAVVKLEENAPIVVLTGIAKGDAFEAYVRSRHNNVQIAAFKDHHAFKQREIASTLGKFANFANGQNWIVTTEKDAVRLLPYLDQINESDVRVAMLPIEVEFMQNEEEFKKTLKEYVG